MADRLEPKAPEARASAGDATPVERMKLATQRDLLARAAAHLVAGTTDMAERCLRVRAEHYTSRDQLQREIRALFRGQPLVAALSPDLPEPGTFLAHEAGEVPLILTRAEDGIVHAFVNACRHRGTRVAEGRGSRRRLSCPFHAWTYDLEGHVCSRPMSCGAFDGVGEEFDKLAEIPCRELAGMVFVLLEGDGIDAKIHELAGAMRDEIADYRIGDMEYFGSRRTDRNCNYKFIMDGFAESYHLKVLHKATIAPYFEGVPGLTDVMGPVVRNIGVRTTIEKELERAPADRRFVRHGTIQYLIPPNAVLSHQVDHVQFWQIYPIGSDPGRCRVELHLYWPRPVDDEGRRKAEFNLELLWKVTTTEDFPQSDRIHSNLVSGAIRELVFGRNEPALIHYHKQIARAAGGQFISDIEGAVRN
jgi:phenylpropionate dioxygenase-like ring-hydroxylating dioxygenase large terminal subunit